MGTEFRVTVNGDMRRGNALVLVAVTLPRIV